MSDTPRDRAAVPREEGEEDTIPIQAGTERANVTHNHYGPTYVIGEAHNTNFGTNYGSMNHDARYAHSSPPGDPDASNTASDYAQPSVVHGSDLVTLLNPILDASHTRNMKVSPPNSACFPGTRLKVTKKIRSWMDSSLLFANSHIMWVYGYAGCGKSAIAQEMARYFAGENRLAASFFFFRGAGDRSRITRFATTVASHVAAAIPATAEMIERAVKANPGLLTTKNTSLADQFEHLVYRPINSVKWDKFAASLRHGPFLIVLDGVDECEDRDEVAVFIERMIEFFDRKPRTPLRFLITSRVENHIHKHLHSSKQVRLLDLVKHTSNKDILSALDAAIAKEGCSRLLTCDKAWPSQEDKIKLIEHIGGSYIFMTTILKSLFDSNCADCLTPMERLPIVLGISPDFDGLYRAIMEPWKHLPHFTDIVSIIAFALEPLSIAQIANLLDIDTVAVVHVLLNLHAIVQVPGDDRSPITLWHTSLRDFLCSEDRSGPFFVNEKCIAYSNVSLITNTPGQHENSPALDYAKRFSRKHWARYMDSMDNDTGVFEADLSSILSHLRKYFSDETVSDFHLCAVDKIFKHANGSSSVVSREPSVERATMPEAGVAVDNWDALCIFAKKNAPEHWSFSGFSSTALNAACASGPLGLVRFLLERGADPNYRDQSERTALHVSCEKGRGQCVGLLLDYGAHTAEGDAEALGVLANELRSRFRDTGDTADIDVGVRLERKVLEHCPEGHSRHVECLLNLSASLRVRSEKTGSIPDIDEAIRLDRKVLEHRPEGHPDHVECLRNLPASLRVRSEKTGSIPDIDEAIRLDREVLEHCPEGHPGHVGCLQDLSVSLRVRSGTTGSIPDIDEAIHLQREALKHRPKGHPDHVECLRNLSASLRVRSGTTGPVPDIDEAICLDREVLEHRPKGHPDHVKCLQNLSISLYVHSKKTGSIPNIDEAICLDREVLEHRPKGHPDHVKCLQDLSVSLCVRSETTGSIPDIDEAIRLQREVLEHRPEGHPEHVECLQNLSASLHVRSGTTGSIPDIDEAIRLGRVVLEHRREGHPEHVECLQNLSIFLYARSEKTGSIPDIDEAIRLGWVVLKHRREGHPDHVESLRNLSVFLHARSEKTGSISNIDEAIRLKREVLKHWREGHPDHVKSLQYLATSLWSRFQGLGIMDDLNETIRLDREVLELHPPGHEGRAKSLKNLAQSLLSLAKKTGDAAHKEEAAKLDREARKPRSKSEPTSSTALILPTHLLPTGSSSLSTSPNGRVPIALLLQPMRARPLLTIHTALARYLW